MSALCDNNKSVSVIQDYFPSPRESTVLKKITKFKRTKDRLEPNFHKKLMELENSFSKIQTIELVEEIITMYKVKYIDL